MGLAVHFVHFVAKFRAPFGHGDGVGDVQNQGSHGDPGKPSVKFDRQQRQHQRHFDQRGGDVEEGKTISVRTARVPRSMSRVMPPVWRSR